MLIDTFGAWAHIPAALLILFAGCGVKSAMFHALEGRSPFVADVASRTLFGCSFVPLAIVVAGYPSLVTALFGAGA